MYILFQCIWKVQPHYSANHLDDFGLGNTFSVFIRKTNNILIRNAILGGYNKITLLILRYQQFLQISCSKLKILLGYLVRFEIDGLISYWPTFYCIFRCKGGGGGWSLRWLGVQHQTQECEIVFTIPPNECILCQVHLKYSNKDSHKCFSSLYI